MKEGEREELRNVLESSSCQMAAEESSGIPGIQSCQGFPRWDASFVYMYLPPIWGLHTAGPLRQGGPLHSAKGAMWSSGQNYGLGYSKLSSPWIQTQGTQGATLGKAPSARLPRREVVQDKIGEEEKPYRAPCRKGGRAEVQLFLIRPCRG